MAVISPKAEVLNPGGLAPDVQVGPFTYLGPDVTIGEGTVVHNNVTVTGRTRIGPGCELFPGCVVGCDPAGGGGGACVIGDGNTVREHAIIEAGQSPDSPGTVLGAGNLLMVGCQIAHDAELGDEGLFANFTQVERYARVEEFVRTSGFTVVRERATVGAYTFTTGYARIDVDAPPYAIMQGVPSRARHVNSENLKRCGFEPEAIADIKAAFKMLFDGSDGFPPADRLDAAEAAFADARIRRLVESMRLAAASPTGRRLAPAEAP